MSEAPSRTAWENMRFTNLMMGASRTVVETIDGDEGALHPDFIVEFVHSDAMPAYDCNASIINSHLIMAHIVARNGTEEQKQHFLPRFATGQTRGGLALTEPNCGTDLQAIRTRADRDGNEYVINGTKTWISNGIHGTAFAVLTKTDLEADNLPQVLEGIQETFGERCIPWRAPENVGDFADAWTEADAEDWWNLHLPEPAPADLAKAS